MDNLLGPLLVLLIMLIGLSIIVFGPKGPSKLFGFLLAPFGCLLKLGFGLLVLWVLGMILVQSMPDVRLRFPDVPQLFSNLTKNFWSRIKQISPPVEPLPVYFDYPVGSANHEGRRTGKGWAVTQDFRDRGPEAVPSGPAKQIGRHLGEDWAPVGRSAAGEPVYAISDGEVVVVASNRSFGHVVIIRHTPSQSAPWSTVYSLYGHLATSGLCDLGTISRGQTIGFIGARGDNGVDKNGQPFAPHLHFEIRNENHPSALDPGFGYADSALGFLDPTRRTSRGNRENDQAWITFDGR
jgi:murein DD-endopeptidase MepM/ murein hydrolase activator NlpD